MLVNTYVKSKGPYLNPLIKSDGLDYSGRKYSTTIPRKTEKLHISKEILNEVKNNIPEIPERPDNLYKWSVELSHSDRPQDKQKAGDVLLLAVLMGSQRALTELGSLIAENAPILSELKLKQQWTQLDGQRFLKEAGKCGDPDAHLNQGYYYLTGQGGLELDIDKALECYERAAKTGLWEKGTGAIDFIKSDVLTKPNPEKFAKLYGTCEKIGSFRNFSRE